MQEDDEPHQGFELLFETFKAYPVSTLDAAAARREIEKVEADHGRSLPGEYRRFVEAFPAIGLGAYTYFDLPSSERGILSVLFGAAPGDAYDLLANTEAYSDRLPPNLVPIGMDPGGSLICLSMGSLDYGSVYCFDQDAIQDRSGNGAVLCARSFSSFIRGLVFEDAEAV